MPVPRFGQHSLIETEPAQFTVSIILRITVINFRHGDPFGRRFFPGSTGFAAVLLRCCICRFVAFAVLHLQILWCCIRRHAAFASFAALLLRCCFCRFVAFAVLHLQILGSCIRRHRLRHKSWRLRVRIYFSMRLYFPIIADFLYTDRSIIYYFNENKRTHPGGKKWLSNIS